MTTALAEGLREAADFITGNDDFAVVSHVNPDADAIGSVLGIVGGLHTLGKRASAVLNDAIPEYARFLERSVHIVASLPASTKAVVYVDSAESDRVGEVFPEHGPWELPTLNIDHHQTNPLFGTANYVDPKASSTSELVFRVLSELGAHIDGETANALLFGIVGDTGSFRNGATTPSSLQVASHLIQLGGDVQQVAFALFEAKTFAAARLFGLILNTIELDRERAIVFACMSQEMLRLTGASNDEAEGVAEYLRGIKEAEVVMLMKETEAGEVRVSMRSRPAVDVAAIAKALGGGGHRQAAGLTALGTFETTKMQLIDAYDRLHRAGGDTP